MGASFLASFVAYLFVGICMLFSKAPPGQAIDAGVRWILFGALLSIAVYYYYTCACVELHAEVRSSLSDAPMHEWWLRVIALVALFLLWFAFQSGGWRLLVSLLVLLHVLYVAWDICVWSHVGAEKMKIVLGFDLLGFAVSVCFLAVTLLLNPSASPKYFLLGMITVGYYVVAIWGIIMIRSKFGFRVSTHTVRPHAR